MLDKLVHPNGTAVEVRPNATLPPGAYVCGVGLEDALLSLDDFIAISGYPFDPTDSLVDGSIHAAYSQERGRIEVLSTWTSGSVDYGCEHTYSFQATASESVATPNPSA